MRQDSATGAAKIDRPNAIAGGWMCDFARMSVEEGGSKIKVVRSEDLQYSFRGDGNACVG